LSKSAINIKSNHPTKVQPKRRLAKNMNGARLWPFPITISVGKKYIEPKISNIIKRPSIDSIFPPYYTIIKTPPSDDLIRGIKREAIEANGLKKNPWQ